MSLDVISDVITVDRCVCQLRAADVIVIEEAAGRVADRVKPRNRLILSI